MRTATTSSQSISGVFLSYAVLGLSLGDQIFGYSLAGADVPSIPDNWVTLADFPTDTGESSQNGGLDLMAGGTVSSRNHVEVSVDLTVAPCWRMLSSPVSTSYANLLSGLWTQGVPGARYHDESPDDVDPNVFYWNPNAIDNAVSNWLPVESLLDPVEPGTGFLVSVFEHDDYENRNPDPADNWPKTITASGSANRGEITPVMNTHPGGWTMVGNPYYFGIHFDKIDKSGLTNVAYIYHNEQGWLTTNGDAGDIADNNISPMQGFLVQTDPDLDGTPSLTFTEESIADSDTETRFYGKESGADISRLRFNMAGEGMANSAWMTFSESGSDQMIRGDALELTPYMTEYTTLALKKEDLTLLDIAQFPDRGNFEIPLHAASTTSGIYKLEVTDFDLKPGISLIFRDHLKGVEIPVESDFTYEFELEAGTSRKEFANHCSILHDQTGFEPAAQKSTVSERFTVQVKAASDDNSLSELPDKVDLHQNYPNPFNPATRITYQLPQQSDVLLEIYDMAGRRVQTLVNATVGAGVHHVSFEAENLSSGVYIYRLQTANQVLSKKLTLIK